ncbi:MAG TPA: MFS transporter, partial [Alphaproteobacteria bacterium]|nr:MFS transporter [Alphaproteobacteria bacterium]
GLNAARTVQGLAGGLVNGGAMEMVSVLFAPARRKRILTLTQVVWMTAQLSGPIVGGAFAEIGWWRGSFWVMLPIVLPLIILAYLKIPAAEGKAAGARGEARFPIVRLGLLSAGVFCVGLAGPVEEPALRILLVLGAVILVGLTFRLDRSATNRLYPSGTLSFTSQVGPGLWIFFLVGMAQTNVMLFLPLLLQVVHGVTPLFVSFVSIAISAAWTIGGFLVAGYSGRRENRALAAGPLFMVVGVLGIALSALHPALGVLTVAALVQGFGIGIHHVLLVARTMAHAKPGEERVTAAAVPSVRSIGTAFGAAMGGMLAGMAGLGAATDPAAVGPAIVFVYGVNLVPVIAAAALMLWLVRPQKS